jgi:hypothetical protein
MLELHNHHFQSLGGYILDVFSYSFDELMPPDKNS